MPVEQLVPPDGITCVRCLEHGHHMKAIEYVQSEDGNNLDPLCAWHRDNDPCPGCVARDKEAKEISAETAKRKFQEHRTAMQKAAPVTAPPEPPLTASAFTYTPDPNEHVAIPKPIKEIVKNMLQDPLDKAGVSIPEALKMFKAGTSIEDLAKHFKVPTWRFWQSAKWTAAKKGISQPAPERKERKPYTRKAVQSERRQPGDRRRPIRATLLDVKAEIESDIADLQEVLKLCDVALARYPE
jgi:hypothetical protein